MVVEAERVYHRIQQPVRLQPAREDIGPNDAVDIVEPGPDQQDYEYAQKIAAENVPARQPPRRVQHQGACTHEKQRHGKARQAVPKCTGQPVEAPCLEQSQAVARAVYHYDARAGRELQNVRRERPGLSGIAFRLPFRAEEPHVYPRYRRHQAEPQAEETLHQIAE